MKKWTNDTAVMPDPHRIHWDLFYTDRPPLWEIQMVEHPEVWEGGKFVREEEHLFDNDEEAGIYVLRRAEHGCPDAMAALRKLGSNDDPHKEATDA